MGGPWFTQRNLALALPVAFALHAAEEAPFFVAWFNAHVDPDVDSETFWSIIGSGFAITLVVAALAAATRARIAALVATAWVWFVMLANAVFHMVAALVDRAYAPGVVTALLLYLPLSALWIAAVSREREIPRAVVVAVALAGGIPMFIHGYLIVFEGGRLY